MNIDRTFWLRKKGTVEQAFSYAKDTTAINFAKKYGGSIVSSVSIDFEVPANATVYSILVNSEPTISYNSNSKDFTVFVKSNGTWAEHKSFDNISDANTEAKSIIAIHDSVIVIKNTF